MIGHCAQWPAGPYGPVLWARESRNSKLILRTEGLNCSGSKASETVSLCDSFTGAHSCLCTTNTWTLQILCVLYTQANAQIVIKEIDYCHLIMFKMVLNLPQIKTRFKLLPISLQLLCQVCWSTAAKQKCLYWQRKPVTSVFGCRFWRRRDKNLFVHNIRDLRHQSSFILRQCTQQEWNQRCL